MLKRPLVRSNAPRVREFRALTGTNRTVLRAIPGRYHNACIERCALSCCFDCVSCCSGIVRFVSYCLRHRIRRSDHVGRKRGWPGTNCWVFTVVSAELLFHDFALFRCSCVSPHCDNSLKSDCGHHVPPCVDFFPSISVVFPIQCTSCLG